MMNEWKYRALFWLGVLSVVVLVMVTFSLNYYTNVYAYFSTKQFEYHVVTNDRDQKFDYVQKLKPKPEALVFGSSNSMRFAPSLIEELSGYKTFNFGLFHARSEDYWCTINALTKQANIKPKLVLFCLDDWNFADEPPAPDEVFEGAEKRLTYRAYLSGYLDDYSTVKLSWAKFKAGIYYEHTLESFNCIRMLATNQIPFEKRHIKMQESFFEDGTRKVYGRLDRDEDITDICERGEFDVEKYLMELDSFWSSFPTTPNGILDKSHSNFTEFSPRRLDYFRRTISHLQEIDCKVIINVMPNHPYFVKTLEKETNYLNRMDDLFDFLYGLQSEYSNIVHIVDNSRIENFGGNPNYFFDYMHPTYGNSELMILSIKKELGSIAVQ